MTERSASATMASNIATSTYCPWPLTVRWNSASMVANAAQTADRIAQADAQVRGRALGIQPAGLEQAAHGLGDDVVSRPVAVRAEVARVAAEAADTGVDQARVLLPECLVADTQALGETRFEVLDHDVGGADEVLVDGPALGLGDVEGDRLLVAVEAQVVSGVLLAGLVAFDGRHLAGRIALAGALDLDDFRALVGQDHGAVRPGDLLLEPDDAHAVQRPRHRGWWSPRTGASRPAH